MSDLRLLVLGVGDAFSALHYSSCLAVESGGRWLLIDCPHPIRKIAREAAVSAGVPFDLERIEGVVLTHLHGDHVSGLEGLGFFYRFILGRRLIVYTHAEAAERLWPNVLAGSMQFGLETPGQPPRERFLEDFFDLRFVLPEESTTVGPFHVAIRPTIHSVPSIALKLTAGRRTLGYSADTQFDPSLIDWLAEADLIIHEANGGFMHTAPSDLLNVAEPIRRKMQVIHCSDQFDVESFPIPHLKQGTLLTV